MRIRIRMDLRGRVSLPINHQYALSGVVYNFLKNANTDYASFLHRDGYAASSNCDSRRFKLFCFSTLRSRYRMVSGASLCLGPGEVEWLVTSPVEQFLREFSLGLLRQTHIEVTGKCLPVSAVETLQSPPLISPICFSCLTPIVCSRPHQHGEPARYLTPADDCFGNAVRCNLIRKFIALHGRPPADDQLTLQWDTNYLQRGRGTKLIEYKSTFIRGAFAPFRLTGSEELIQLLYDTGAGEKNSGGFGMVEVSGK